MKLHRYVDHQRLHIVTKDVISLYISVLLLFRHLVPPAVAGYYAVLAVLLLCIFLWPFYTGFTVLWELIGIISLRHLRNVPAH